MIRTVPSVFGAAIFCGRCGRRCREERGGKAAAGVVGFGVGGKWAAGLLSVLSVGRGVAVRREGGPTGASWAQEEPVTGVANSDHLGHQPERSATRRSCRGRGLGGWSVRSGPSPVRQNILQDVRATGKSTEIGPPVRTTDPGRRFGMVGGQARVRRVVPRVLGVVPRVRRVVPRGMRGVQRGGQQHTGDRGHGRLPRLDRQRAPPRPQEAQQQRPCGHKPSADAQNPRGGRAGGSPRGGGGLGVGWG